MKIVSVNTGLPREVAWRGGSTTTGIFKQPVGGRIALRKLNLDGDEQADLSVHGGEYKAVYCYPLVHYDYWRKELPGHELPMASLERILRRMACSKIRSILAIGSLSVPPKSS
jgi:MOSC domain-containing protein YiiM